MAKEKGNIALIALFVLLLIGGSAFIYYKYYLKGSTKINSIDIKFPFSAPASTPVSSSAKTRFATTSNNVYYKGKVLSVVEDKQKYRFTVTLQPQDDKGKNIGSVTTFIIPKYPPKTNASVVGSDFKQMIDKGFNPINIAINYDKNKNFLSWESLAKLK